MLSPEEIAEQQQLLATHRRTLAVYLRQQAGIGRDYSPPALVNGIDDARANIRRIKAALSAAGVAVPEDPDDEEPPPPPRLVLPRQSAAPPRWLWPALAGVLALALVGGLVWYLRLPIDTVVVEETPIADAATAAAAAPGGESPAATDMAKLEGQLADANIELSDGQVENVRSFLSDPDNRYFKEFARHALQVVGDQKFRQPLYLDEMEDRYSKLVTEASYFDFDTERLKEAMVRAWNEHYTDQPVDSYDQIVEAR